MYLIILYYKNYIINDDLTINVNDNVNLGEKNLKKLPEYIQFNIVKAEYGYFAEQRDEGRRLGDVETKTIDVTDTTKELVEQQNNKRIKLIRNAANGSLWKFEKNNFEKIRYQDIFF